MVSVAAVAALVAGCGTTGVQPLVKKATQAAASATHGNFFVADTSTVWQYEAVAHPLDDPDTTYTGTETVTVDSVRRSGETTVLNLRAIDDYTSRYRFPVVTEGPDGVTISNVTYWGAAAVSGDDLSLRFLSCPLIVGSRWDDGQWIGKAVKKETVSVPAGTFEAWNLEVIGTYDQAYTAVGHYWVARGKGIVKSVLTIPGYELTSRMIPAGKAKRPSGKLPRLGR
jgi:hypothetical protein